MTQQYPNNSCHAMQSAPPLLLSTGGEPPRASAFAAALLPPLEGHPSMEDVFTPGDLLGPRPRRSFTGQRRSLSEQQRLPSHSTKGRCICRTRQSAQKH